MAKKITKPKEEKIEREYIIPLREKCRPVPRYRKAEKAIKTIKEFLVRHMKIRDRDLTKIKIDSYVNELVWLRGIKKPPHKIKVKVVKEGDIVRVEAIDLPNKLKFKKLREEKAEKKAAEAGEKKKAKKKEESKEEVKTEEEKKTDAEKKATEKEKAKSGAEAAQKVAETAAKQVKKAKQPKMKEPKRQIRKALAK